jgi:ADP-heptose:LPS heptosyltransferase
MTTDESINLITPDKVKNILIVKQHNQFGDMLCTLPSIAAVRKKYPDANITLVCSPGNYEILTGNNPYINDFLVYDKTSILKILRFFKRLRKKRYDISVVPSTVGISRTSHIINRISGAKFRVGVKSVDGIQNINEKYLNIKKDFYWNKNRINQTERFLDIVRQIGCDLTEEEKKEVKIKYSGEEENFVSKYFSDNFKDNSRPVVAFHAGAGKIENRWSISNFESLIDWLYREFNIYVLLIYGKADKELVEELCLRLSVKKIPFVVDYLPIRIASLLFSKCKIYITNDTGTMHSASYSGAKVISLFGPTKYWEWAPGQENCEYIQSPTDDIDIIKPEQVFSAARKYLIELK